MCTAWNSRYRPFNSTPRKLKSASAWRAPTAKQNADSAIVSAAATFASVYRLPQRTIRAIVGSAFEHLKIVETVKLTYLFASLPRVCDSAIDAPRTA